MADMLLSALIPIVMQKSADSLVQRIGEMWGIDDQREKLHDKLLAVQGVLINAEKQGDANLAVKSWLTKLKSAAYDADDVLDEFCYEELRREALRRGQKVGNVSDIFSHENPVLFRYKMSKMLKKVVGRIDELATEMERFNFVQGWEGRVVDRDRTLSCVIESEVVGRKDERENLVKLLTEVRPTENLMVLSVVGMGGLGKTTLAQLVYNDPRVKEHFKLLIWVCVSEEFDVGTITKLIIDHVIQKDCKVSCDNKDLLRSRLQKEISGKRYLLVLDDVWNENVNKWEQLRAILNCGDLGSAVVVTTRSGRVATIMGAVQCYNLGCLGEEDSWNLFQKRAFSKGVREELVEIGRKLVKNCGGLPIAIKTLGSLMSFKDEVRQWLAVLEQSTMWENEHSNDNDGVLSVLRLSYDHLPSYMKQCFAFCSIFPKDHVMEKEKLVQYWMAHGFIPSDRPGDLEMRGSDVFNELVWRSFFQDVEQVRRDKREHKYHSQTTCKMHDLMHDLAQYVMRDDCLSLLKPLQANNNLQGNIRHILLREFPKDINDVIQCYPAARTLIPDLKEYPPSCPQKIRFVKSNFLRVLDLSNRFPRGTMITPRKMKHLRYLDLSGPVVTAIPEAITTLYLLQTLRLIGCHNLSTLPEGMRYMISLQHLNIEGCSNLKCMPPYLGELKCLQTLTRYIVGTGVGNKIGELKSLTLGGKLKMYNLNEVRDARDAREANMASKEKLDHLALHWEMPEEYNGAGTVVVDPFEVLDALKPCSNLKVLKIDGYSADRFPVWMMEHQILRNLVELHINKCRRCTNVMQFHMLPLLQILEIHSMDNLRYLCCAEDAPITFPSLKYLKLKDMPNLDCWCEGDVGEETSLFFPVLRELLIYKCPMLSAIPTAPLLEQIEITGNNILSCLAAGLTTLRFIHIVISDERENNGTLPFKPWKCLVGLHISGFNHIIPRTDGREGEELSIDVNATALRKVEIISSSFWFSPIPSNSPLWLWKCFRFIERLYISECDSLSSWPEKEFSNLINLRVLIVNCCKNFLGSLSEPLSEMSSRQILLPKLEDLSFFECLNMVEVPKLPGSLKNLDCWCEGDVGEETSLFFPVLRELSIFRCPMLSAIPTAPLLEQIEITGNKILSCLAAGLTTLRFISIVNRDERENNGTLPFKPWKCLEGLSINGFNHIIPRTDGREGKELSIDVNATALRDVEIISSSFWFSPIPSNSPLWLWKCFIFIERLYIFECDSLSSWPEKEFSNLINLRVLKVKFCKNFLGSLSEPLSEMSSRQILLPKLECLNINECPNMVEVPKLPESLKKFKIIGCNKLESLPEWLGSLVALKKVRISSCENFNFLPSSIGGLTALEELSINGCIKIASLPEGMQGLEALKILTISDWPEIRVLPEGLSQRLRSLDRIRIGGCPLLERDFRKHGKYWHLISEIQEVYIGVEDRSSKMRDLTQLISSCKIPCLSAQS